jgi:hypothetical protein
VRKKKKKGSKKKLDKTKQRGTRHPLIPLSSDSEPDVPLENPDPPPVPAANEERGVENEEGRMTMTTALNHTSTPATIPAVLTSTSCTR